MAGAAARELSAALTQRIPQILDEVVEALRPHAAEYAEFLVSERAAVLPIAERALERLLFLSRRPDDGLGLTAEEIDGRAFEEIGRAAWREGRLLQPMLSAYRAGARIAWRHISAVGIRRGVGPDIVAGLAEAIFVYVDELVEATVRGWTQEQSVAAGERERLRVDLADLLLSDRADRLAVEQVAAAAAWPVPSAAAVVLVAVSDESVPPTLVSRRLGLEALPLRRPGLRGAIVPDPVGPGRRERLCTALAGLDAVVGEPARLADLPATFPTADLALGMLGRGALPAPGPVFCEDHLAALLLHRDPRMLAALAERRLAPVAGLPPSTRERLLETLRAWLDSLGDRQATAENLHVHPQTVRYRLGQLRDLFGDALDDPQARFELLLVLRAGRADARD